MLTHEILCIARPTAQYLETHPEHREESPEQLADSPDGPAASQQTFYFIELPGIPMEHHRGFIQRCVQLEPPFNMLDSVESLSELGTCFAQRIVLVVDFGQ